MTPTPHSSAMRRMVSASNPSAPMTAAAASTITSRVSRLAPERFLWWACIRRLPSIDSTYTVHVRCSAPVHKGGSDVPMANPLHWEATDPGVLWSPGNVSEAIPGVSTPLNWSFVGDAIELAARSGFAALGVLARSEITLGPRAEDRFIVAFCGRTVANIEKMRMIGDRMPGATANGIEQQLFGVVRDGVEDDPTYRRWPAVAGRMPLSVARIAGRQREARAGVEAWWRGQVLRPPTDGAAARALLADAPDRYPAVFELGTPASMLASALFHQVSAVCRAASGPGPGARPLPRY